MPTCKGKSWKGDHWKCTVEIKSIYFQSIQIDFTCIRWLVLIFKMCIVLPVKQELLKASYQDISLSVFVLRTLLYWLLVFHAHTRKWNITTVVNRLFCIYQNLNKQFYFPFKGSSSIYPTFVLFLFDLLGLIQSWTYHCFNEHI